MNLAGSDRKIGPGHGQNFKAVQVVEMPCAVTVHSYWDLTQKDM